MSEKKHRSTPPSIFTDLGEIGDRAKEIAKDENRQYFDPKETLRQSLGERGLDA